MCVHVCTDVLTLACTLFIFMEHQGQVVSVEKKEATTTKKKFGESKRFATVDVGDQV